MSYKVTRVTWALLILCGAVWTPRPTFAADKVTASVAITNAAGTTNGQTITVNGDVRTWTNNVVVSLSQVLTNSTPDGAKTNLYKQIGLSPLFQVNEVDAGSTNLQLIGNSGVALTVTLSAGWGTVSYSTQTVASAIDVQVPYTVLSPAQQTNVASGLFLAIASLADTNQFFETDYQVQKLVGLGNAQSNITGQKSFLNRSNYFAGRIFGVGDVWCWSTGNVETVFIAGSSLGGITNSIVSDPSGLELTTPSGSVHIGSGGFYPGMDINLQNQSIVGGTIAINTNGFFGNGAGLTNVPASALVGSAWLLSGNNATTSQFLGPTNQAPMRLVAYSNTVALFDTNNAIRLGRGHTVETNTAFDSIIAGGYSNVISKGAGAAPTTAAIIGGNNNTNQGQGSFIAGGFNNFIGTDATTAAIIGGNGSTNFCINGFVAGQGNSIYFGNGGTSIPGGKANLICPAAGGLASVIGGGSFNYLGTNASACTLAGGSANNMSNNAAYSFIGGGGQNTIGPGAGYAVVPGGFQNRADSTFTFAAGHQAKAVNQGAFVWADSQGTDYSSSAADTFNVRAQGGFILNGPMKLPWFELSTLGNGINQDIVVGGNLSVNVSGPTGAFTIEGIAGGTDGMVIELLNLTTFNMTVACEGGATGNDPVAANRIITMTGADQTTTGNGFARLKYKGSISRWVLSDFNP